MVKIYKQGSIPVPVSGSATACQMLEEMYDTGEGDEAAMWAGSAEEYIV